MWAVGELRLSAMSGGSSTSIRDQFHQVVRRMSSASVKEAPAPPPGTAEKQVTDESRLESSAEFNDDPQWKLVFLEHYDNLCRQSNNDAELLSYDKADETELKSSSLLQMLTSAVGDLSSITIPISYIEPTSFLQRLCEPFLCSNLLDQAAATTTGPDAELERLALIATFFISAHCNNIRSYKPFNPLLGETFEYVREGEHPFKFIAEQVSHHPPIAATHAHNDKWEMWDEKRFGSKFGGNSLTMTPLGKFHLVLKTTDEHFTFEAVTCTAHNVIVGSTWVEHHGTTVVRNLKTGSRAEVTLEKSGWISRSRYDTKVSICDAAGTERMTIDGKWTEAMTLHQKGKPDRVLWRAAASPPNKYGFSAFAEELNRIGDVRQLPATDSRLRADRMWLAKGEMEKAGAAKKTIENKQREAKKLRVAANKNWIPRFFVPAAATDDDPNEWHFNGRYWAIRERRLKEAADSQNNKKNGKSADGAAASSSSSSSSASTSAAAAASDDNDAAVVTAGKSPRKGDAAAVAAGKSPRKAAADDEQNNNDDGQHSDADDSLTGTDDEDAEPSTPRTKAAKAEEKKKKRAQRRKAH